MASSKQKQITTSPLQEAEPVKKDLKKIASPPGSRKRYTKQFSLLYRKTITTADFSKTPSPRSSSRTLNAVSLDASEPGDDFTDSAAALDCQVESRYLLSGRRRLLFAKLRKHYAMICFEL
jgi:hypothetical protein